MTKRNVLKRLGLVAVGLLAVADRDQFTTEWEFFEKGQRTMTETETFTRVK
jgi:hypothetical protein